MKRYCSSIALVVMVSLISAVLAVHSSAGSGPKDGRPDPSVVDNDNDIVATIDLMTIYAFHPAMQYYDQNMDLFIRQPAPGTKYEDFMAVTQSRRKEFQDAFERSAPEIKSAKGEIDVLKKEIERLDVQKRTEASDVSGKFDARIAGAAKEDEKKALLAQRTQELSDVGKKFDADIALKNKNLAEKTKAYEKTLSDLLKIYYLTPEETAKKFDEINDEIVEVVKYAAKKNGIKAVMNYSRLTPEEAAAAPAANVREEKSPSGPQLEDVLANGPDYSKAFNQLKTFDENLFKNDDDESMRNPEHVKFLKELSAANEKENASKLYFSKRFLASLKPIGRLTAVPFIYGGADLTWYTLICIMVKNGIPKEKAEAASEVILKYYDREKGR